MAAYEHICPITCEPIVNGGMTVCGSVYEYDAIKEWLRDSCADPLTNLCLPSTHVVRVPIISLEQITEMSKSMMASTINWSPSFKLLRGIDDRIEAVKRKGNELRTNAAFVAFDATFAEIFAKNGYEWPDGMVHPTKPPSDFNMQSFAHLTMRKMKFDHKHYKSVSFDGADLSDTTFWLCDLSRCTFINTNLSGARFAGCTFKGEEVCFGGAFAESPVIFLQCKIESPTKWDDYGKDPAEWTIRLKQRQLKCAMSVK